MYEIRCQRRAVGWIFNAAQFRVTKPVIDEFRFPHLFARAAKRIFIRRKLVGVRHESRNIRLVEFLSVQFFRITKHRRGAAAAAVFQTNVSRDVFSEIERPAFFRFPDINSFQFLAFADRR